MEVFTEELSSKYPGGAATATRTGWAGSGDPRRTVTAGSGDPRRTAGLRAWSNGGSTAITDWLERENQGPPLVAAFLRGFMFMGLNSIGLVVMSTTPQPFFSSRTVKV